MGTTARATAAPAMRVGVGSPVARPLRWRLNRS